jgi:hypothetical protein
MYVYIHVDFKTRRTRTRTRRRRRRRTRVLVSVQLPKLLLRGEDNAPSRSTGAEETAARLRGAGAGGRGFTSQRLVLSLLTTTGGGGGREGFPLLRGEDKRRWRSKKCEM